MSEKKQEVVEGDGDLMGICVLSYCSSWNDRVLVAAGFLDELLYEMYNGCRDIEPSDDYGTVGDHLLYAYRFDNEPYALKRYPRSPYPKLILPRDISEDLLGTNILAVTFLLIKYVFAAISRTELQGLVSLVNERTAAGGLKYSYTSFNLLSLLRVGRQMNPYFGEYEFAQRKYAFKERRRAVSLQ